MEWLFFRSSFSLRFSRIVLLLKQLPTGYKTVSTMNGLLLWFFCWDVLRFVTVIFAWTENCKNLKAVILFWRHEFFSVFSLSGFMVCSLLASEFSNTDSLALPKQYKTNSCNCATSSPVLWQKMMKQLFLYFWKPNIPFSVFFQY